MDDPVCEACGEKATCFGKYGNEDQPSYSCDECCDHSQEDGQCAALKKDAGSAP